MLTTPVLVIIFNRPDFAGKLYQVLSEVKPTKLYVVSDGARTPEERLEVEKSRGIFKTLSWECQISYDFSESNIGLRNRISSGITWALNSEEKLIILEDDCIPSPDFFPYCTQMLEKYENDERIMCINGCNLNPMISTKYNETYFFSRYSSSWGWATWKRAWKLYDSELEGLKNQQVLKNFTYCLPHPYRSEVYWKFMLTKVQNLKIDSWSYRWMFSLWINNGLAIVPKTNLIQNIGNDNRSSNTKGKLSYINIETSPLDINSIKHPTYMVINSDYDNWLENNIYSKSPRKRFFWLIKRIFTWFFPI